MTELTVAGKVHRVELVLHKEPNMACDGCVFDYAARCPLEEGNRACISLPYGGWFIAAEPLTESNS